MKIICLGDSITYGLGVSADDNWVALLNKKTDHLFVNKGISGDTSGGMLARFKYDVIDEHPDYVFLMGGANDLIMGCDLGVIKANFMAMVHQAYFHKIKVVIGIEIQGDVKHIRKAWASFTDFKMVALKLEELREWMISFGTIFHVPYIDLNQEFRDRTGENRKNYYLDGLHPNGKGHLLMAEIILETNMLR